MFVINLFDQNPKYIQLSGWVKHTIVLDVRVGLGQTDLVTNTGSQFIGGAA